MPKARLSAVEGTLQSVTSLLQDVKTTVIAAGNATLSDAERGFQATELRGRFDELMGLANSRDALGNYMFSGIQDHDACIYQDAYRRGDSMTATRDNVCFRSTPRARWRSAIRGRPCSREVGRTYSRP